MIARLLIVTILMTAINGLARAQTIVSQSNIVQTQILIPLNLSANCDTTYFNPNETKVVCLFDLGFSPKQPFTFDIKSDGDMYFEHEYKIQGQNLVVTFINAAWVDDADFVEGDELRFQSKVLNYFSSNAVSLVVTLTGPQ